MRHFSPGDDVHFAAGAFVSCDRASLWSSLSTLPPGTRGVVLESERGDVHGYWQEVRVLTTTGSVVWTYGTALQEGHA